jgi:CHAT domain-containing protein
LEAEVARFYESVSKRKAGAVGLGALLEPIRAARGAKRVLVSAGGALESVPFAALPLDGEPLAARLELVHVPSTAAVALRRSNRAASPTKPVAILADPDFGGAFPRLRFSGIEAEQVKSILPLATVATGADASRDRFDRLAPRDFEILHFATHAFVDPRRPELSGIILANGGSLRLPEIYNLDLRARLVVLSACRSATGADLPGEGVVGLARAFLYAGARGVLATLWDVDDRASAELVRRFYAGMVTQRLTPAAALRAAQDSLRADPRWRDPYFWAGLTLHGDWI